MSDGPPGSEWTVRPRDVCDCPGSTVLATIVTTDGAAYRRPGAKTLVTPDGDRQGSLTPGCLRDRITDAALAVLDSGDPRLASFDLGDDDTWDLATGCDGRIEVLFEPVTAAVRAAFRHASDRDPVTVYTVVESSDPRTDVGDRAVRRATGDWDRLDGVPAAVTDALASASTDVSSAQPVTVESDGGTVRLLVDPLEPAPRLLLFGGHPDIHPVARLGRAVGFEVVVVSPRDGPPTVPAADTVHVAHPTELPGFVDEWTYPVVLSHNVLEDSVAVESLLCDSSAPYVGLLGSRDRSEDLVEAVERERGPLSEAQRDRLSTPVGLDVGGDGPTAVALSIVAEVHAVHHGRDGRRHREKSGRIHDRP